jgi:hypothetical protein
MPENAKPKPHQMREGTCYLVKERKPLLSYKLFEMMLADGSPGFCVTRQYPERLKDQYKLERAQMLWLSQTPTEASHNPTSIGALVTAFSKYLDAQKESALLLDGVEYLVVNNGFQQVLKFIEHLNELVMRSRAILIIPISPDAFDKREMALIERNMEVIESPLVQIGKPTVPQKEDIRGLLDKY